tara:strand:+ start:1067 stop:1528 length:462 start_codon:yes stop_codon:yes gene_type:complete
MKHLAKNSTAALGALLIVGFVVLQVIAQINLKDDSKLGHKLSDKQKLAHERMHMLSETCALVGLALLVGANHMELKLNPMKMGTAGFGTLLLVACIALQIIAQINLKDDTEHPVTSGAGTAAVDKSLAHKRIQMLSNSCGLLAVALLSGAMSL